MAADNPVQGGTPRDLRTVFVRNVAFSTLEKDIEEVFGDIGPVRRCFLVRAKDAEKHKGFGFVQFALAEDAERAVERFNGSSMGGRKIKVELAIKRVPLKQRKRKAGEGEREDEQQDEENAAPAPSTPKSTAGKRAAPAVTPTSAVESPPPAKKSKGAQQRLAPTALEATQQAGGGLAQKWVRTIALGTTTAKLLATAVALAEKQGKIEATMRPADPDLIQRYKLKEDGCPEHVALLTYASVKEALHAVTQLHQQSATKFGQQVAAQASKKKKKKGKRKREDDDESDGDANNEAGPSGLGSLPTESELMWARQLAGEGQHVKKWRVIIRNMPFKATEQSVKAALEPAGFVWQLNMPRKPDGTLRGFAFASFTTRAHAEKAIQLVNATAISGRTVAVDWAVPKSQYADGAGGTQAGPAPVNEDADTDHAAEGAKSSKNVTSSSSKDAAGHGRGPRSEGGDDMDEDDEEGGGGVEALYSKLKAKSSKADKREKGVSKGGDSDDDVSEEDDDLDDEDGWEEDLEDEDDEDVSDGEEEDGDGSDDEMEEDGEGVGTREKKGGKANKRPKGEVDEEEQARAQEHSMLHNVLSQILKQDEQPADGSKKANAYQSTKDWEPVSAKAAALIQAKQRKNTNATTPGADAPPDAPKPGEKGDTPAKTKKSKVLEAQTGEVGDKGLTPSRQQKSDGVTDGATGGVTDTADGAPAKEGKQSRKAEGEGEREGEKVQKGDETARTVFIRGLPVACTREELHSRMMSYGAVKSARVVMDKSTGKPRGTAFVEFVDEAGAKAAAAAAALARDGQGPELVVGGRPIQLHLAVDADQARKLASSQTVTSGKSRQQLAKEGHIEENTPAWNDMSEYDRVRRKRAAEEKNQKLQSPNYTVSSTRLSIRNIPKAMTEKELKALVIKAIKQHATKAQPVVKQVKILTDENKKTPEGVPRSKGLGFVELTQHDHALAALRHMNNNPNLWGKERRPIVEFAMEQVKILKARQTKLARQQARQAQVAREQVENDAEGDHDQPPQMDGTPSDKPEGPNDTPGGAKQRHKQKRREKIKAKKQRMKQEMEENGGGTDGTVGTPVNRRRLSDVSNQQDESGRKVGRGRKAGKGEDGEGKGAAGGFKARGRERQLRESPGKGERRGNGAVEVKQKGERGVGQQKEDWASPGRNWNGAVGKKGERGEGQRKEDGASPGRNRNGAVGKKGGEQPRTQTPARERAARKDTVEHPPNKRRRKDNTSDKLDSLVAQYKARLFGGSGKDAAGSKRAGDNSLKHWYE